jgi:hypothetical protein
MLVIDQLDAVSLASDRNPELFEVLKDIIRQADAYPRMRLLLTRRRVDLDNDYRLRTLTREGALRRLSTQGGCPKRPWEAVSGMGSNGQAL